MEQSLRAAFAVGDRYEVMNKAEMRFHGNAAVREVMLPSCVIISACETPAQLSYSGSGVSFAAMLCNAFDRRRR